MVQKDTKLRFWCQKVLPLVYDDSLSYYELLNKVVLHLNQHTEDINALIDFYNTFAEDVRDIINEMMENGDFNEIVADTLGGIVAQEYKVTESYEPLDYAIYESKLYACIENTSGVWDESKWRETTVGDDLTTLMQRVYTLNASQVLNDSSVSGNTAKDALNALNDAFILLQISINALNTAINNITPLDTTPTANSTKGISSGAVYSALHTLTEITSQLSTMKNVPTGLVGFRANTINQNTTGFPADLEDYLVYNPNGLYGRIIGGWQANGNYQGMMFFTDFSTNTKQNVERIWIITYATSSDEWSYFNHDKTIVYTESGS